MTTTTAPAPGWRQTSVIAEDAPLYQQLWPTRDDRHEANFTLTAVATVRTVNGTHIEWLYANGNTRQFTPGDRVVIAVKEG